MRRLLFALLFCLSPLLLAACGSSDQSVDGLLSQTFSSSKALHSGRVNAQLDANVQGIKGLDAPVRLRLNGPFESQGKGKLPRFDFTLGITVSGQSFTAGGVSLGDKGFVRVNGQAYSVPDKLFQQFTTGYLAAAKKSQNDRSSAPSLGALGVNPRRWLRGAHKVGEEDVGGVRTIHITAGLNVPSLLDDLNKVLNRAQSATSGQVPAKKLTDAQRRQIIGAVRTASVDVFTGKDDKLLRRLDVKVGLQKSGKVQGGNVRLQLQFDALNNKVDIKAPTNTKPLDQLVAGLQGGVVPKASGSAATPPAADSATAPSTAAGTSYMQCLQSAGDDVAKLQRCAEIQGK